MTDLGMYAFTDLIISIIKCVEYFMDAYAKELFNQNMVLLPLKD